MCLCLFVLCSPAASRSRSRSSLYTVATVQMFIWLCQAELRDRDLAEVGMSIYSLWRVHLFNLETCLDLEGAPNVWLRYAMIHLCIAVTETEIPRGLKPNYAFFLELSANWQIAVIGQAWITWNRTDTSGLCKMWSSLVECMKWEKQ